jgi:hypothetical protein
MTAPVIEVGIEITPALVKFNRIAGRFTNFEPVLGGRIDVAVRKFMRERFESEGRVGGGGRWVKLTPKYAAWKRVTGRGSRKILQYSGEMMAAFTERGAPHQVLTTGPDYYHLSVDEEIQKRARGHQHGWVPTGLPIRKIVPDNLPLNFITALRKIAKSYVVTGAR